MSVGVVGKQEVIQFLPVCPWSALNRGPASNSDKPTWAKWRTAMASA